MDRNLEIDDEVEDFNWVQENRDDFLEIAGISEKEAENITYREIIDRLRAIYTELPEEIKSKFPSLYHWANNEVRELDYVRNNRTDFEDILGLSEEEAKNITDKGIINEIRRRNRN